MTSLATTDALAWVVVAMFVTSALLVGRSRRHARYTATGAWGLFAVFWGLLVPHFMFTQQSPIEGVLSAAAVPLSLYTGYLVFRGRNSLLTLTRAVAFMGVIYLPFETITLLQQVAIETVTRHVEFMMAALGYSPTVIQGPEGYRSTFEFFGASGHRYTTTVLLACTGVGSTAIVSGLVLAVDAPFRRRLQGVAIVAPVIYALNVVRVLFIALAHGKQWFAGFDSLVYLLFSTSNPRLVSYLFADRVVAQSLSVVALVVLVIALMRIIPELSSVVEDLLYLVTGNEYDLRR